MHFLNGVSRATLYKIKQPSQKERYIQLSSSSSSRSDSVRLDTGQNPMLSWRHFIQGLGAIHTFWWPREFLCAFLLLLFFVILVDSLIKQKNFMKKIPFVLGWMVIAYGLIWMNLEPIFCLNKSNLSDWFCFSNTFSSTNADHDVTKICRTIARFPFLIKQKTHTLRVYKTFWSTVEAANYI